MNISEVLKTSLRPMNKNWKEDISIRNCEIFSTGNNSYFFLKKDNDNYYFEEIRNEAKIF